MSEPREIVLMGQAQQALAEAKDIDEVKQIHDKAKAAEAYARAHKMGLEIQNDVAAIILRASRRGGEMLKDMNKNKGGQPEQKSTNVHRVQVGTPKKIEELGGAFVR